MVGAASSASWRCALAALRGACTARRRAVFLATVLPQAVAMVDGDLGVPCGEQNITELREAFLVGAERTALSDGQV